MEALMPLRASFMKNCVKAAPCPHHPSSIIHHLLLPVFLLFCLLPSAFAGTPGSVQATYDVYKNGVRVGKMEETYTRNGNRYTLSSVTTPADLLAIFKPGKIFSHSNGLIGKQGLQPLTFSHRRERDAKKNSQAEFDWKTKQLALTHQGQRTTTALPDGTQDRLSAMYQFMFLALKPETTLAFSMTNGNKLDSYLYAVSAGGQLKTPAGEFNTLYLDNQAPAGEHRTEIWLAVQQGNLPCKMILTDSKGDQLTQVLGKLALNP